MRTLVLHPVRKNDGARARECALSEAVSLARALDLDVRGAQAVQVAKIRAGTFFGTGKLQELGSIIEADDVGLVIVDAGLTPVQQRNLERAWNSKVLDRTGLILEIFGERAQTREGVLQVELAHLNYQKSRLVRSWTHLERQRGGFGFLGGPGETQIEADRRALNERITRLRADLRKVASTRRQHRAARSRARFPIVALVGYTNAGKSTLFNSLTGEDVAAKDMLFATLDPTMRSVDLPSGRSILLSDTVGFISKLPTQLIAAFRATLEDVLDADLILHVRDMAHKDSEVQSDDVQAVLSQIGTDQDIQSRIIEVWNKIDALAPEESDAMIQIAARTERVQAISALTGQGIPELLSAIESELADPVRDETLCLGFDQGRERAWLFDQKLVSSEVQTDAGYEIAVRWSERDRNRFQSI